MKKLLNSFPFAILLIVLMGVVGAYRSISRREQRNTRATELRIKEEVSNSMKNLKIDLPPLSAAGQQ
jgi:hypothetical protein